MAKVVEIGTGQPKQAKNPAAVSLGRLGGLKGGYARAAKLTSEKRSEIAQRAAKQRWAKEKRLSVESKTDRVEDSQRGQKLA